MLGNNDINFVTYHRQQRVDEIFAEAERNGQRINAPIVEWDNVISPNPLEQAILREIQKEVVIGHYSSHRPTSTVAIAAWNKKNDVPTVSEQVEPLRRKSIDDIVFTNRLKY